MGKCNYKFKLIQRNPCHQIMKEELDSPAASNTFVSFLKKKRVIVSAVVALCLLGTLVACWLCLGGADKSVQTWQENLKIVPFPKNQSMNQVMRVLLHLKGEEKNSSDRLVTLEAGKLAEKALDSLAQNKTADLSDLAEILEYAYLEMPNCLVGMMFLLGFSHIRYDLSESQPRTMGTDPDLAVVYRQKETVKLSQVSANLGYDLVGFKAIAIAVPMSGYEKLQFTEHDLYLRKAVEEDWTFIASDEQNITSGIKTDTLKNLNASVIVYKKIN